MRAWSPTGRSWLEATSRARVAGLVDAGTFHEVLPPWRSTSSAHLAALGLPGALDDGVVVGSARLEGMPVVLAAQEGQFIGGSVGETHGAKIVGILRQAVRTRAQAVLLLIDSGGVRLHEANAGLLAISEIMRAVLDVRAAGIPVIGLIGGSCGAFGGMGIVACLCDALVMSEQGRLGLSGPDVIETVAGVEEFDAKDRALVWRVTGGKHRYLMGDCAALVDDRVDDFRRAAIGAVAAAGQGSGSTTELSLDALMAAQAQLEQRRERFAGMRDGLEVWSALGIDVPGHVAMLEADELVSLVRELSP